MRGTVSAAFLSCMLQAPVSRFHTITRILRISSVPVTDPDMAGHEEVVRLLLDRPEICVNVRNNDRLTTFMLAGQFGREGAARGGGETGAGRGGGQEQLRRMMDLPCLTETDWATTDRVSCCSFFIAPKRKIC